jgi:Ca2+-binding RTX toxin-like protein
MASFIGSAGGDVANAALGIVTGFSGGSAGELQDGIGDFITGNDGSDFIFAGNADDVLEGGDGSDTINGGEGNDRIYAYFEPNPDGSAFGDELSGNIGDDTVVGSGGNDTISGARGTTRSMAGPATT